MKNLLIVFHILLIITLVGCTKDKGVYVGEGIDGKRHGQGTVTYSNGKKYVGEFKNGKKHGQGTETYPNGSKYVGEFKNGKYNGQGTFTYSDGRKYVGEFKNWKQHGKGVSTARDGQRWYTFYDGEFKKGHFHGQGKLVVTKIDDDGTLLGRWNLGKWKGLTIIGEFRNGNFWDTKSYNDKGEQQTFSVAQGKWYGE
jgi:hypothetical protein|tara:strand:+ start:191 stop:781 length:591 start_codon:yes stop_codon:yes gene_type:complete